MQKSRIASDLEPGNLPPETARVAARKRPRAKKTPREAKPQDLQEEVIALREQLAARDFELSHWRQQYFVVNSLWTAFTHSRSWKLSAPLRMLRQFLLPRGFDERSLIPWQQIRPLPDGEPGSWETLGPDPQFLIPCFLPAGWVRVRLQMAGSVRGWLELFTDVGKGFDDSTRIERAECRGEADLDFFAYFPAPVRAVRFDPLDVDGVFHLKKFRIDPVPLPQALLRALKGKIQYLRSAGLLSSALWNGLKLLGRGRFGKIKEKFFRGLKAASAKEEGEYDPTDAYEVWRRRRQLSDADRERMRAEAAAMTDPPKFSVLMPVYDAPEEYLRLAVESVLRQTYPHWELCIADDASTAPHVRPVLEEYARKDARIKVVFREERGNISEASNSALALAEGDYIALLDHDDELAEHALFRMAREIVADRSLDMLYSDEDKLELDGGHVDPFFKPDWSPEYFMACMYTCHLGVYRTALVREIGGFRSEFDSAQDYDLVLRLTANTKRIRHVPDILYHWRKLPTSAASGLLAKPEAPATGRRALRRYLESIGREGSVESSPLPGMHRVRFAIQGRPKISIIIPSACRRVKIRGRDTYYLLPCLKSILRKSTYTNFEIVVMHAPDASPRLLRRLARWGIVCEPYETPFNWSAVMNRGAARARGDYYLFLNDDMEVITPDWLESMLEYAQQPEIGAVGAKLLFPSGRLQHVGVALLNSRPGHPFYQFPANHFGYFNANIVHRNCSAVTGACLMTRADLFRALGGFDSTFPINYNDVDYCLRAIQDGRRIVYMPYAQLYHYESMTRTPGASEQELEGFLDRWAGQWPNDPYYNPNLSQYYYDYRLELNHLPDLLANSPTKG